MQKVLTKYWLTVHVGLLVVAVGCWVFGVQIKVPLPIIWLSVLAAEAMVLLPSVRRGETLADSRLRVAQALVWDPSLYLGFALFACAVFQCANGNSVLTYMPESDTWQFSAPAVGWLPSGVDGAASRSAAALFAACCVGVTALRQAAGREGKRFLIQTLAAWSGAVALYKVWLAVNGVEPAAALAWVPGAANAGSFFGFWLVLGMGAFVDALARQQRGVELLYACAFVGNLVGLLFFAEGFTILLFAGAGLLLLLYWTFYLSGEVTKSVQLRLWLLTFFVVACMAAGAAVVFKSNPIEKKVGEAVQSAEYWSELLESKRARSDAALNIWQQYPWVGVGANGFQHYVGTVVSGKDWARFKRDQACTRNDALQFLCEYGGVGLGLILAWVVTLLVPILYRLRLAWTSRHDAVDHDSRLFLFKLPPLVVVGLMATVLTFTEGMFGNPLRMPTLFLSVLLVMASLPSFLPSKRG